MDEGFESRMLKTYACEIFFGVRIAKLSKLSFYLRTKANSRRIIDNHFIMKLVFIAVCDEKQRFKRKQKKIVSICQLIICHRHKNCTFTSI